MIRRLVAVRQRMRRDEGFTLVEMLVASIILAVILTVTMSVVFVTNQVVTSSRDAQSLTEEARIALNRMARELRQASAITSVTNPGVSSTLTASPAYATYNPAADTSITFQDDFNGNGTIEPDATDPEVITYQLDYANSRLLLQAGGQTLPVLASNVTGLKFNFTSRQIAYDGDIDGVKNGIVDWEELDADPAHVKGNGNHQLDATELPYVDSVQITLTLFRGHHRQVFQTQVDLRNGAY